MVDIHSNLYLSLFSFFWLSIVTSVGIFGSESLVLFSDFIEFLHVLEEVFASLQGDEKLSLLAVTSRPLNSDGSCSNLLECGVIVSNKVFRSNNTGGYCISEGVQFDCFVSLKVLFAKENVEVWILFY